MIKAFKYITIALIVGYINISFFWNPFPKRLLGEYTAIQESYSMWVDGKEVSIPELEIKVELLNYEKLIIQTPNGLQKHDYSLKNKTKSYFNLSVQIDNDIAETWKLFKRPRKIIRPEQSPRPATIFLK